LTTGAQTFVEIDGVLYLRVHFEKKEKLEEKSDEKDVVEKTEEQKEEEKKEVKPNQNQQKKRWKAPTADNNNHESNNHSNNIEKQNIDGIPDWFVSLKRDVDVVKNPKPKQKPKPKQPQQPDKKVEKKDNSTWSPNNSFINTYKLKENPTQQQQQQGQGQ